MSKNLARATILFAVLVTVVLLAPGRAAAATPCWKQIVTDWSVDGSIDKTYTVSCYRAALNNLPEDVRDYTSLGDDIQSAIQAAASLARTPRVNPAAPERPVAPEPRHQLARPQ